MLGIDAPPSAFGRPETALLVESRPELPEGRFAFVGANYRVPWEGMPREEEASIRFSVESRKSEFATGRWCAKRALSLLGVPCRVLPVGPSRAPAWPEGSHGSISHAQGFVCALVTRSGTDVGLDVERLDRRIEASTWEFILTGAEARIFASPRERLAVFSAKESLFKALSARLGRIVDFHEVELRRDAAGENFEMDPDCIVAREIRGMLGVRIGCEVGQPFVFTWALARRL